MSAFSSTLPRAPVADNVGGRDSASAVAKDGRSADEGGRLRLLLRASAGGDRQAFRLVYQQTSARLYAVVRRFVWVRGEAEEVLQEVYLKIWRHARDFDATQAQPLTWMHRIAHNKAIDHLRREALRSGLTAPIRPADDGIDRTDREVDQAPLPDERLHRVEELRQLQRLLDALGARQRQVLMMRFADGLSQADIATQLGAPLGSVKSWMRRGLQQLRSAIERQPGC